MKKFKKLYLFGFMVIACVELYAQQDPMFTHYMYNTLAVNPGYAGSRDALTITGLHRTQWVDFSGAPVTQTLTMHMPVANDALGWGLSFITDKIGPTKTTSLYADFAFRIKLTSKAKLAVGLKGGLNIMHSNLTTLKLDDQADASFQNDSKSKLLPNFGAGIYYQRERFYAGLSAPKLLENDFSDAAISTNKLTEKRHYFFIAGAMLKLSNNTELKPTAFVKAVNGAPVEADVTTSFIFNKKLLLGVMYRTGDAIGCLLGFNFTEQLHAGYSYDWSFGNQTFKYNQGSHEIMLSYDLIYKHKGRVRSPRYF